MKRWFFFLFSLILFQSQSLYAQFTISGEFRPRSEYRHGYKSLLKKNADPAFFTDQRTRLNFKFETEKYTTKLVLQDIRTWGSQSQLVVSQGSLTGIHEAWVSLRLSENWALKTGRQEIILDDHRIFGSVGWAQQARSHDALLFESKQTNHSLKIGAAFNQNSPQLVGTFYDVLNSYKTFQFLWYTRMINDYSMSFLALNNGLQGGTSIKTGLQGGTSIKNSITYFSQTIGTRLTKKTGIIKPSGSLYYQFGEDGTGNELSALEYSIDMTWIPQETFSVKLGFEHLSGNSATDSRQTAFQPFYGTNHKFNGFMDYFYVGNHANNVGLNDLFVSLKNKRGDWNLRLDGHVFSSDERVIVQDPSEKLANYLGTEIDFVLNRQMSSDVNLKIGYSQMFATKTMEALKGGDASMVTNWGWAMLTVKPSFFTSSE